MGQFYTNTANVGLIWPLRHTPLACPTMAPARGSLISETVGTALLVVSVVGSSHAIERMGSMSGGLSLLIHALVVGSVLTGLVIALDNATARFNPAVSLFLALKRQLPFSSLPTLFLAQFAGALVGLLLTHLMFDATLIEWGKQARFGPALWVSEVLCTFGFLVVLEGAGASGRLGLGLALGAYVAGAMLSFPSTCFFNPALTMGRSLTNTFASIRPVDVLPFCLAQWIAAFLAAAFARLLAPSLVNDPS